ncbi:hypothetical protein, partial [Sinorhizobium meliloti]|uniref:hypothetical protein n=1 Tax=Rhizobium meliloti TaxID=382 RepID=UPI001AECF741
LATNRFTVHLRQIATTYLVILIVAPSHPNCRAIPWPFWPNFTAAEGVWINCDPTDERWT